MMMCKPVLLVLWLGATSCAASYLKKIPKLELRGSKIENLEVLWMQEPKMASVYGSAIANVKEFAKKHDLGDLLVLRALTMKVNRSDSKAQDEETRVEAQNNMTKLNESGILVDVLKIMKDCNTTYERIKHLEEFNGPFASDLLKIYDIVNQVLKAYPDQLKVAQTTEMRGQMLNLLYKSSGGEDSLERFLEHCAAEELKTDEEFQKKIVLFSRIDAGFLNTQELHGAVKSAMIPRVCNLAEANPTCEGWLLQYFFQEAQTKDADSLIIDLTKIMSFVRSQKEQDQDEIRKTLSDLYNKESDFVTILLELVGGEKHKKSAEFDDLVATVRKVIEQAEKYRAKIRQLGLLRQVLYEYYKHTDNREEARELIFLGGVLDRSEAQCFRGKDGILDLRKTLRRLIKALEKAEQYKSKIKQTALFREVIYEYYAVNKEGLEHSEELGFLKAVRQQCTQFAEDPDHGELERSLDALIKALETVAEYKVQIKQSEMLREVLYDYFTTHKECTPKLEFLRGVLKLSQSGRYEHGSPMGNLDLDALQGSLETLIEGLEDAQRPRVPSTPSRTTSTSAVTVLEKMMLPVKDPEPSEASSTQGKAVSKKPDYPRFMKVMRNKIKSGKPSGWDVRSITRDGNDIVFGNGDSNDTFEETERFPLTASPTRMGAESGQSGYIKLDNLGEKESSSFWECCCPAPILAWLSRTPVGEKDSEGNQPTGFIRWIKPAVDKDHQAWPEQMSQLQSMCTK